MDFLDNILKPKFSREKEKEFLISYAESRLMSARLIQVQIFLLFIAAGYLDYVLLGELATLMTFMRYILFTPVMLVVVIFSFTKYFSRYMQLTFCVAIGVSASYVTLFTILNEDSVAMVYFVSSTLVVFIGFVYVPMLFRYAAVMAVVIFVMCCTSLIYNNSFSDAIIEACILLLLGSVVMALAACYANERSARLNYNYEQLLNLQKDDLEESNVYLQELATVDGLTGVANRRAFDARLVDEWKRAERAQTELTLLLLDVDFFKLYNDSYGHQKGDECLIDIATALKSMVRRAGDFVARYGGEEFVFVISNSDHDNSIAYADSVREKIESLEIPHIMSSVSSVVTMSIGVATTVPGAERDSHWQGLIKAADRALYQAKSEGRNRVVSCDRLTVPIASLAK